MMEIKKKNVTGGGAGSFCPLLARESEGNRGRKGGREREREEGGEVGVYLRQHGETR